MRKFTLPILSLLIFLSLQSVRAQSPTGNWAGTIDAMGMKLDLYFSIEGSPESLSATLDVPVQGLKDFAIDKTTFSDGELKMVLGSMQAEYAGTMAGNDSIKGTWYQAGMEFDLDLGRSGEAPELKRPQTPQEPFPYSATDHLIPNKKAKLELGATLTIPEGKGPFPAVILISGSGPQDRDETLVQHQPFWVIADHLSRNGIAVLRYDDRGFGASTGNFATATSADFATDVQALFKWLRTQPQVDPSRIGLVGHSEGGLIGPLVAAKEKKIAFVVMLAGPGIPGDEIIKSQSDLSYARMDASDEVIRDNTRVRDKILEVSASDVSRKEAKDQINAYVDAHLSEMGEEFQEEVRENRTALDQKISGMLTPWFRYFLRYDPVPTLQKVRCPVLAVNGTTDVQVVCDLNLDAIDAALKDGKTESYTIHRFDQLNHLFQHSETGDPSEYGLIEETFAPEVLEYMTAWILKTAQ